MHLRHTLSLVFLLASLGLGALTSPVLAGPREDVISGSQRCAVNADGRSWLDCYYGAAQPMRAQLGLPPAPASQLRLVPAAGYAPPPSAQRDTRDDVVSTAQRCASLPDDRSWLDCYYGSAQPLRALLGLPPAPASQTRLVPPANYYAPPQQQAYAPQPAMGIPAYGAAPAYYGQPAAAAPVGPPPMHKRSDAGFFGNLLGNNRPVVNKLRMVSFSYNHVHSFTVTLSDGEVWVQLPGDDTPSFFRNPASQYVVSVFEGALGTYNLEVQGEAKFYKATRVK